MIDDAQVRVRVVLVRLHNLSTCVAHSRWLSRALTDLEAGADHAICSTNTSPLLFLCALLEEDFPQDILLLPKSVIILHVVVVGLVEDAIRVVVAVGVLVANAADLAELHVRVSILVRILLLGVRWHVRVVAGLASDRVTNAALLCEVLARQQEHLLVEAADDGYLWLSLLLMLLSALRLRRRLLRC